MQLICDSHHGIYCPQITLQSLIPEIVAQLPQDAVKSVLYGPDEWMYWESWEDILNQTFTFEGKTYRLEQDDDVWMLEVRPDFEYTYHDERGEFKGWVSLNDETVFQFDQSIFEDGFMKHRDDLNGLMSYLIDLDIMQSSDNLVKA